MHSMRKAILTPSFVNWQWNLYSLIECPFLTFFPLGFGNIVLNNGLLDSAPGRVVLFLLVVLAVFIC